MAKDQKKHGYGYWKKMKKLLLQTHICNEETVFCRQCLTTHKKQDPCKMRFKKLQKESQKANICYVSYTMISDNFNVDCWECYKNEMSCELHQKLRPYNMCNALIILRKVSLILSRIFVTRTKNNLYKLLIHQVHNGSGNACQTKEYYWNFDSGSCDTGKTTLHWEPGTKAVPSCSGKAKTNFNGDKKSRGLNDIVRVNPKDAMECFVKDTLIDPSFCNTVAKAENFYQLCIKPY